MAGQQVLTLLVAHLLERSGTVQSYASLGELNAVQGQSLAGRALVSLQELAAFLKSLSSGHASILQLCWHKLQLLLCCAGQI